LTLQTNRLASLKLRSRGEEIVPDDLPIEISRLTSLEKAIGIGEWIDTLLYR
jgi:hypothetical protein